MKRKTDKKTPSAIYTFLVKAGMDEEVALEINEYEVEKGRRRKRMENKDKKDDSKWK